nr:retrovirus-related Pol polyprotein from transposon TNT 1-94 [Tanacetum cinerariifolium]
MSRGCVHFLVEQTQQPLKNPMSAGVRALTAGYEGLSLKYLRVNAASSNLVSTVRWLLVLPVSHKVKDFVKRLRSTLGEEGDHYMEPTEFKIQEMVTYRRPLLDDYKKGKKINDLQLIMCGDMFKKIIIQGKHLKFEKLMIKKFKMSMMGELTYFLGLQIKQDDKGISIFQEQYTRNLLKKYEISNSSSVKTPMVPPNNLGLDLAIKLVNETSYRGMIGSLMYLKGTPALGLYYPKYSGFNLKGYLDSDYVGCNMDKKSTLGACQILGGKLVYWSAKKQQSVAMSSVATEFWCMTIAYDPNPSTDENKPRPLKEFLIKFTVMNGKKPLTLDFNTFTTSTDLDYNNGAYVAHPSPEDEKFRYLPGILSNFKFSKDPSKFTKIELRTHMISVNNQKDSVSPPPLSIKKKKGKSQTITSTLPKSQGPEASEALSKKRKQPNPKKTPSTTSNSKDSGGNDQLADHGFSMTSNEGTAKTMPHLEGLLGDKDLGGIKLVDDMEAINPTVVDLSGTGAKYHVDQTYSTRLRYQSLTKNKGFLLSDDEMVQESDEEKVFEAREDMDEDTQEGLQSSLQHYNSSTVDATEEVVVSYIDLKAAIEALKDIQNAVKEDPILNKKVLEATKAYIKNSTYLTELLTLIKNFNFQGLNSSVKSLQAIALTQEEYLASWAKSSTSLAWNLGPRMTAVENKEEMIKKATKEAKLFEMTKTEVIKVVQEEAKKIRLDPKKNISVKAGEKFKKAQDVKHRVLKRKHSQKAKRAMELKMKRVEQYMWTMSNRLVKTRRLGGRG